MTTNVTSDGYMTTNVTAAIDNDISALKKTRTLDKLIFN